MLQDLVTELYWRIWQVWTASELLALLGNISSKQVHTDMTTPEKLMCCFAHGSQDLTVNK